MGYLIAWDLFAWLDGYWAGVLAFWVLVVFFWSLKVGRCRLTISKPVLKAPMALSLDTVI